MNEMLLVETMRWIHTLLTYPALIVGVGLALIATIRQLRPGR